MGVCVASAPVAVFGIDKTANQEMETQKQFALPCARGDAFRQENAGSREAAGLNVFESCTDEGLKSYFCFVRRDFGCF